jgi:hypothetical protein
LFIKHSNKLILLDQLLLNLLVTASLNALNLLLQGQALIINISSHVQLHIFHHDFLHLNLLLYLHNLILSHPNAIASNRCWAQRQPYHLFLHSLQVWHDTFPNQGVESLGILLDLTHSLYDLLFENV